MTIVVDIPGRARLELEHLVLDVNGTLTDHGELLAGVEERLSRLRLALEIHLVSGDTFGTLASVAEKLEPSSVHTIRDGSDKLEILRRLGPERCAVVGNGTNDVPALKGAALGLAVLGPEGTSTAALMAADAVCRSILDALDLLLDERALQATLRV